MKRVFIVHGWEFNPQMNWYPWLKRELEMRGYEVIVPMMPDSPEPDIKAWVSHLKREVGQVDRKTYFVGHSIGCQAIIRFLSTQTHKMGGAILVAGWFALTPAATPTQSYERIAKPWLLEPIDFAAARRAGGFTVFLSSDDPYVPLLNKEVFEQTLGAKVIVEEGKGHYSIEEGVVEVPQVLDALTKGS